MVVSISSSEPEVPMKTYDSLYIRMRTILRSQDLWSFVTDGYADPTKQVAELALTNVECDLLKENKNKDNKALGLIQKGLNESNFTIVSSAESSKKAWDILESCYQGASKVKIVKLHNLTI